MGGLRAARREVVASRPMLMAQVRVRVVAVERLSPTFRRLRVAGPGLAAYTDPRPGDALRLVVGPGAGTTPVSRAYWWAGSTGEEYDEVARPAWGRARDRGLDVDDPIVVDEVLAEGVRA